MSNTPMLKTAFALLASKDSSGLQALLGANSFDVNQLFGGRLLLVEAARTDAAVFEVLISKADVNGVDGKGCSALIAACEIGFPSIVQSLLNRGANPNYFQGTVHNALKMAVRRATPDRLKCLKLLVDGGADVNLPFRSQEGVPAGTVLMEACRVGNVEAVNELIRAGADINANVVLGTPLMRAAENGHDQVAKILLAAGADPSVRLADDPQRLGERAGKSAADLALSNGFKKLASLLSSPHQSTSSTASDLTTAWRELEKALKLRRPDSFLSLRPAAAPTELTALARLAMTWRTAELTKFFGIHDGQNEGADTAFVTFGTDSDRFRLLSLAEVIREWKAWRMLLESGEFTSRRTSVGSRLSNTWYNPSWVPITSDGMGNSHCIDISNDRSGVAGQILMLWHDREDRPLIADSLTDWLVQLREQVDSV
jgi:cell wall assembly regulator SMI1